MSDDTQDIQDSSGQTLDQQSNPAQALDQQTNPTQQQQTPQAQTQPNPARTQPTPQAQAPQAAPQAGQQPQSDHAKWFNKVFEVASGGPVRYTKTNPTTGEVTQVVQHRPMKAMAASILAGAVAGMMGGLQAPDKLNAYGQRDLSGAAQAGGQAGQQVANAPSQQAQKLSDQQLSSAIALTDHNLKQHAMYLANTRLEGENMDAANARLKGQANDAAPIIASMDATYKDLGTPNTSQEMSGDELEKKIHAGDIHVARESAFISGSKPIIGPDGQIAGYMPQYRVYDPTAKVAITDDIKKAYPRFANAVVGQTVPVRAFWNDFNQKQNDRFAQSFGSQMEQDFKDAGIPVKAGTFNSVLPQLSKYNAAIAGLDPDQIPDALRKAGASESTINQLTSLYPEGYKAQTFALARETEKKKADAANDPDKQPVPPDQVASFPADVKKSYPGLTPGQVSSLQKQLGPNPTQKDYKDIQNRAEKYDAANTSRNLAREKQDEKESGNSDAVLTTPDALGFAPNVPGGLKEYNKRQGTFKKNADDLQKTEGTYQQFNSILDDVNAGKDLTGAQSVVALFNAIGISATPLAGKGFRINNNTIQEHAEARGLGQSLYQKLLGLKEGDVITPQQVKDYATIAAQARQSQYINLVNQVHNQGLNANFVLPTGNGQKIDPSTAKIFLQLTGGNADKARLAAQAKGWTL